MTLPSGLPFQIPNKAYFLPLAGPIRDMHGLDQYETTLFLWLLRTNDSLMTVISA